VKFRVGAVLGNGQQYMSWIHIDDLCRMIVFALENSSINGVFNACAPNPVTHREFIHALARKNHRKIWLPSPPDWLLKIMLGEKADLVLKGQRVDAHKIVAPGFVFRYNKLDEALTNLIPS
jgi:hypothetical protein